MKMVEILVPLIFVGYGCFIILGLRRKWKAFVDPEKNTANIFESGLYVSKSLMGDEAYAIFFYIGGGLTIIAGIILFVLFNF